MPARFSAAASRQIEVRRVDADEHVGRQRLDPLAELAAHLQKPRQVRQHLGEPHDRELLGAIPRLAARRDHLGPRDADERRIGHARLQRLDEPGAERVARRLAGDASADPSSSAASCATSRLPREAAGAVAQRVEERLELGLLGHELLEPAIASSSFSAWR